MANISYATPQVLQNGKDDPASPVLLGTFQIQASGLKPSVTLNFVMNGAGKSQSGSLITGLDGSASAIFPVDPGLLGVYKSLGTGAWNDAGGSWFAASDAAKMTLMYSDAPAKDAAWTAYLLSGDFLTLALTAKPTTAVV